MNDNYYYRATHCAACDVQVEPQFFYVEDNGTTHYVYTRFCDKLECKQEQQEYYNSYW